MGVIVLSVIIVAVLSFFLCQWFYRKSEPEPIVTTLSLFYICISLTQAEKAKNPRNRTLYNLHGLQLISLRDAKRVYVKERIRRLLHALCVKVALTPMFFPSLNPSYTHPHGLIVCS
jgi:peptidoglycan/LPS O-acetylase OafA/YrhL